MLQASPATNAIVVTKFAITPEQEAAIRGVAHLASSQYKNLDIAGTLDFFRKRYVEQIVRYVDPANCTLCDCGAGYGWLSFAYLLSGGMSAHLVEYDLERLKGAREIARILRIADRCSFTCGSLHALPFATHSIDVFVSLETVEHVGRSRISAALQELARVTSHAIVLTTPNKAFPVDLHDTGLPLTHWLPRRFRDTYSRLFGRSRRVYNDFVSPRALAPIKDGFRPVTPVQTFPDLNAWLASYPHYSPYGTGSRKTRPPRALRWYLSLTSGLLGVHAHSINPNLACIWLRREPSETMRGQGSGSIPG
jgi:ubiquinone/menaquinone biosynthesis C-methylase UbiE